MKHKTSKEAPEFDMPIIPEGVYTGTLEDIQYFDGEFGKGIRFYYFIKEQDVKLTHICTIPQNVNPKNKLGALFLAHGKELGEDIEDEDLIGTKAKLFVEDKERTKDGQKTTFSNISKVKKIEEPKEEAKEEPKAE